MKRVVDFSSAFILFFNSWAFIRKHSLLRYLFLPLVFSLICFLLTAWGVYSASISLAGVFVEWMVSFLGWEALPLSGWASFLIGVFSLSASIVMSVFIYRFLVSIIVLPFLGPLLERVEVILNGRAIQTSFKEDLRNAFYGMKLGLYLGLWSIVILAFSFFTGPFQVPINFIAQSYFMGRSSFDYIFEKLSPDLSGRKQLSLHCRYGLLGNGAAYVLFLFVPLFGALFGPIFSLIAAARWHSGIKEQRH